MKTVREGSPNQDNLEGEVKCTRCRNKHKIGDRLLKRTDPVYEMYDEVCPKCEGRYYYFGNNT